MVRPMKRLLLLLLACAVLTAGCRVTATGPAKRKARTEPPVVTEDMERRLRARAEEYVRVVDRSGLLYEDRELEAYVNEIAGRLLPAGTVAVPVSVKVIKSPDLNAFALLTGRLYVNTGFLAAMDNEAQLASLLGHEITHAARKHRAKEVANEKQKSEKKVFLPVFLGSYGEALGLLGILEAVKGYSRELEAEADTEGLKLAVNAGYDPREAPKLFELLKQEIEREKIKVPLKYSDHPQIEDRIKSYEALVSGEYAGKQGVKNADLYQRLVTRLLLDNAELDLKRGNYEGAGRAVEKYMARRPKDARAHYLMGEVCRADGRERGEEQARDYYRKAISLRQNYPEPYRALGLMAFKRGEKQEAGKHLRAYLSFQPGAPDRDYIQQYIRECD